MYDCNLLLLCGLMMTVSFQWYNDSGDVEKAISVMLTALQKHTSAITAGGYLSAVISWLMLLDRIDDARSIEVNSTSCLD